MSRVIEIFTNSGRRGAAKRGVVTRGARPFGFKPVFEMLEARRMLAVSAVFAPATGALSVFGDGLDNTITVSRQAGGAILVNGGAVSITGGVATVANTARVQVFGLGGDDVLSIDEANGAMPAADMFGGTGNDTITGGSGNDRVFGQRGGDTLLGKNGFDLLFGGSNDDTLTGGDADDQVFGQSGADSMVWNPGDDTDLNEGGADVDTTTVHGGAADEQFTTTANGTRVRFDRLNPAAFSIDIGTTEKLMLNANGGNDSFSATGNLATLISITVDGGAGQDTLLGSNGIDTLIGGDEDDFIDGQQGNDVAQMGAGNDTFQWDPGDGSDTVEGQAGVDKLVFNGSAGNEIFEASANGARTRLTRNLGTVVMDLDDVEQIDVLALGGTDSIIANNLAGTDVVALNLFLAGTLGGAVGDSAVDSVILNATGGEDVIIVSGSAGNVAVAGLAALVNIFTAEPANDRLTVNSLVGDDTVDASGLASTGIALTLDGGDDDDALIGGDGADTLLGGAGDDVLIGGPGVDVLDGGTGDNVLIQ